MSETALLLSRKAADVLAERGLEQPRLDAELILAHVLGISRLQLYLQHDRPLTDEELALFRTLIRRRLKHEPVQYLTGSAHFRHIQLAVDPRVLIPRPETEELVGHVLEWAWGRVGGKPSRRPEPVDEAEARALESDGETAGRRNSGNGNYDETAGQGDSGNGNGDSNDNADIGSGAGEDVPAVSLSREKEGGVAVPPSAGRRLTALDLCTGSGAIALSLAKEGPFERVVATDISAEALAVAGENARRLGLDAVVELRQGVLWEAVAADERFDVVVSNPPYVAEEERSLLPPEVAAWEPAGALFAGPGGFAVIEPIIAEAPAHLRQGGLLALEIGAAQGQGVLERLEARAGYATARVLRDMAGRDRVALAQRCSLAPDEKRGDHA